MIVPDVNLLLYAYDSTSPHHTVVRNWWQAALSGNEVIGLPAVSIFGFVRVGTNPRVYRNPMTAFEAVGHVRSWLSQPIVRVLTPGPDHVLRVCDLLVSLSTRATWSPTPNSPPPRWNTTRFFTPLTLTSRGLPACSGSIRSPAQQAEHHPHRDAARLDL